MAVEIPVIVPRSKADVEKLDEFRKRGTLAYEEEIRPSALEDDEEEDKPRTLASDETMLHRRGDAFVKALTTTIRYAFAKGRMRVRDRESFNVDFVLAEVGATLNRTLPKTLLRVVAAGGEVGASVVPTQDWLKVAGGPGSGNFGHAGRPGQVGGSTPDSGGGGVSQGGVSVSEDIKETLFHTNYYQGVYYFIRSTAEEVSKEVDATIEKRKRGFVLRKEGKLLGPTGTDRRQPRWHDEGEPRSLARKPIKFKFNSTSPQVVNWAEEHAADLVTQILESTRKKIRQAVVDHTLEGDWDAAVETIKDAIGDEDRAERIARHETHTAASAGQRMAWEQAVNEGYLETTARRTWIVVGDEKTCPICADLDGAITDLTGMYPGNHEGPPAHIMCRCTEGII